MHAGMNILDHPCRLAVVVLECLDEGGISPAGGDQPLGVSFLIEVDQPVGPVEDRLGGAVVSNQPNRLGPRPIFPEAEDMLHLGPPPGVDRLIVVPHDTEVFVPFGQRLDDPILTEIGILILIDEDMIEPAGFGLQRLGKFREDLFGQQQLVVEVDRPS